MQAEPAQNDHAREARLQHTGSGARLCRRNMTAVGVQENSAQETAYRAKRQRTITAVQECWLEERAVVPVLRRLTAELGPNPPMRNQAIAGPAALVRRRFPLLAALLQAVRPRGLQWA